MLPAKPQSTYRLLPLPTHPWHRKMTQTPSTSEPQTVGLVIVGDEILSGKRADKHMPKLIELLAARGMPLSWADYVGDAPERITATLKRAFNSGDLVFSCG